MVRLALFVVFFSAIIASGAAAPKKPLNLYQLPPNDCAQLAGCGVRPADGVKNARAVDSIFEPARRTCCAGKGGVCGCADGQSVCCDGALNSACGCD
jgi:hypothetical protein